MTFFNGTVVEVSYEIANKVGGIYTVVASKMENILSKIKDYYVIGPFYSKSLAEFEEEVPPVHLKRCFELLKEKHGIDCKYGKWFIEGKPKCILIDPGRQREKINEIKGKLWEIYKIDSLGSDWWFNEPLPWSWSTGIVIEELYNSSVFRSNTIAHFHEWLSGAGLLYLKSRNPDVKTVFTTHATVLGRTIAEVGREDLYKMIRDGLSKGETMNDSKAYEYNLQAKHLMEKACCNNADVFTTVSHIVAMECEYILGRKPDVILPNGLNMENFPIMEELSNLHISHRERIRKFLMSYFSPYYEFDVKNTLLIFTSGRFEFRNKGIDVFIDSLGKLNQILKGMKTKKHIVAFIWIPCETRGEKGEVMENISLFNRAEEIIERETEEIKERIMECFAKGILPGKNVMDEQFLNDLRKMILQLKAKYNRTPPISPFDVPENSITLALKRNGLLNRREDKVKVIYYPAYLSKIDGLLAMDYYNAVIGCHVGVFPSYYEPWGYTPLETAALGLQTITTDLSGFGTFISSRLEKDEMSIVILPRMNKPYEEIVDKLTHILLKIYKMDKRKRGMYKIRAKQLSLKADWKVLIKNYLKAYSLAMKR